MESLASNDISPTEMNDKERNARLKTKVLQEIISSELSYLSQLDMLLNVRNFILKYCSLTNEALEHPTDFVNSIIMLHLLTIYFMINSRVLSDLLKR